MEYVLDIIKKIAVFYILSTFLINLINDEKYKKYVKMFSGIVVIILVIKPIGHIFSMDKVFNNFFDYNEAAGMSSDLKESLKYAGEKMSNELIEEFENKTAEALDEKFLEYNLYIKDVDIEIGLNSNDSSYGTIKSFIVYAGKAKGTHEIYINGYEQEKDIAVIELKKYISEVYKINKNNIYVNISL